jgi:hypothetical protein
MSVDEADWELTAAPEGKYLERGRRDSQVRLPLASKMASSLFRGGLDFWKAFGLPAVRMWLLDRGGTRIDERIRV